MNSNDLDINDVPGGISKEADLRFFAIALAASSNAPPRSATSEPLTEEDIWNQYSIRELEAIQGFVINLLVDSGLEAAKLATKWGTDDDLVTAPEPKGHLLEIKELKATGTDVTIWSIYRFSNLVQIFPHGPGASGAGPHEIWLIPVILPHPSPLGSITLVH